MDNRAAIVTNNIEIHLKVALNSYQASALSLFNGYNRGYNNRYHHRYYHKYRHTYYNG